MNRRTLILSGIVLLVIAVLASVWFFFFRSGPGLEVGQGDPFGNTGAGNTSGEAIPGVLEDGIDFAGEAGEEVAPRLVRITDAPVAFGSLALYIPEIPAATSTDGTVTPAVPPDVEIRFVERQSGNAYAYRAHARTLTRISNQTVPGVQEAVWVGNGSLAYLRFLSDNTGTEHLETYALPAGTEEGGYYLEQGIESFAATSSSAILTLRTSTSGSIATVATPSGENARTAFSSALSDLIVSFLGRNYLAVTKASASVDGYAFLVSDANGSWSRLVGPLRGLTAIASPTGSSIIYSYLNRGALATSVLDTASRVGTTLPISTHAEKCVYARDGASVYCAVPKSLGNVQPDDWYQGEMSFSDRIWRIDLAGRAALLLLDPSEVGDVEVDAVSLAIDPTEDILTFTNRRDGSLWAYDL